MIAQCPSKNSSPRPKTKPSNSKRPHHSPLSIAKTACAFAIESGGFIILGVRDKSREIIGIDELEIPDLEEKISNIAYTMVEPTPAFNASVHNIEGIPLLKIEIFPGSLNSTLSD